MKRTFVGAFIALCISSALAPGCKCSRDSAPAVAAPSAVPSASAPASASVAGDSDDPLCKRFETCGCALAGCAATVKMPITSVTLAKPGVRDCMMASRCASLCERRPDQCGKLAATTGGGGGGGAAGGGGGGGGASGNNAGAGAGHGSRRCAETSCTEDAAGAARCQTEGCGSCLLGHCVVF